MPANEPVSFPVSTRAAQFWTAQANGPSLLVYNPDPNNTIAIGKRSEISLNGLNIVPLQPLSSVVVDSASNWFAISSANGGANLVVIPGGTSFFQPAIINGTPIISSPLFIYSGIPAFGNLTETIGVPAGSDQFGNTTIPGTASYQPGTPTTAITLNSSNLEMVQAPTPGGAFTQVAEILGILTPGLGGIIFGSPGSAPEYIFNSGSIKSLAGTPANPTEIATDTWQAFTSFSNGWTGSGRYKLMPLQHCVWMQATLTPGTLTDATAITSVASGYFPTVTQNLWAGTRGGTAITNDAIIQVLATGIVQCLSMPTGATTVRVNGIYALD